MTPRRPVGYNFVFFQTVHAGAWHIADEREMKQKGQWRALCGLRHGPMVKRIKRAVADGVCRECEQEIRGADSVVELSAADDGARRRAGLCG